MKKFLLSIVLLLLQTIFLSASDWRSAMDSYNQAMEMKQYKKALSYAYESLTLSEKEFGTNSEYYASSLGKLGEVYYILQNYDSSLKYYLNQREILKAISKDTSDNYAYSCNNISVIYQLQGKFREAEQFLKESIEIKYLLKGEIDTSYAKSLHNLGNIYKELVDFDQAEKTYLKSLEIKKSLLGTDNVSYAVTAFNLAGIYKELGNYSKAKTLFEECLKIYKSKIGANSKEYKQTTIALADIYIKTGDVKQAEKLLDENITQDNRVDEEQADILFTKALIKYNNRNYDEAEKLLLKTKSIIEASLGKGSPLYASCVNNLGIVYWRKNNKEEAYRYLMEAILIREKILGKSSPEYATSIHNLAGLLKDLGKLEESDKYYKEAFDIYLQQIKIFFPFLSEAEKEKFYGKLRNRLSLFNCYGIERMKTKPEIIGSIYDYQIATKALLLNNSINVRKKILESGNQELINTYNKWRTIREELSKYYKAKKTNQASVAKAIDSLDYIANNLEKELSRNEYFKKEYAKQKVSWKDIQKTLKPDEAVVEIIRFQFKYNVDIESDTIIYLALILTKETKDLPEVVIFYNGYEMENFYINGYQNSIYLELDDKESYSYFWEKIDAKLKNKKKIYVSQDGVYNKINLNTLQLPDGSYLIDNKDIIIVSNSADILQQREFKSELKTNKAILIGYPKFLIEPDNFEEINKFIKIPMLPGTKAEIEAIKEILDNHRWSVQIVMNEQASKPLINRLQQYGLIHIATHGYFKQNIDLTKYDNILGMESSIQEKNPLLRSGLLLAGAENTYRNLPLDSSLYDDGQLTAYDVMNLDLMNADLVVLSACQTGIGEIRNGDGVYGLQRAFLVAGAKSLIMSLWKVNDKTTQDLMEYFYKFLSSGYDIYTAFKMAELELRKHYPHPFYWGAFVVIGNIR